MVSVLSTLLIFLLLLPFFIVVVQTNIGIIKVGDTLTAGDEAAWWLSPAKDFAFGFQPFEKDHFLLAIWYYKLTEVTIVWSANGNNLAPRGSQVELTAEFGLVLRNPQGDQMIWRSDFQVNIFTKVRYGLMKDMGNFVLVDGKNATPIWESFKHPTDTLLPTQIMELGGALTSRKRLTDFSTGTFQFQLLETGNAVLDLLSFTYYPNVGTYYETGTTDSENKTSSAGYRVIFDESGSLYVLLRNKEMVPIIKPEDSVQTSKFYVRVTIDFHGVLTLNYHPKNSSFGEESWKIKKAIPDNICVDIVVTGLGYGSCGYNSICKLKEDGTPSCKCPVGYSLVDSNDEYSGCKPDFSKFCDGNTPRPGVEMAEIQRTDWPQSDFGLIEECPNAEDCKKSCFLDCFCEVAIYHYDYQTCWKKKLPLPNGRENAQLNAVAFLKILNTSVFPSSPEDSHKKKETTLLIVVCVLLGSSIVINFILVGALYLGFLLYYKKNFIGIHQLYESSVKSNLRRFSYKELTEATNGFEEELGRGSCGVVFKGETELGTVAVKILDRMFRDNDKEFRVEVNVIGQTHHKNLVRLIGYCDENNHRLLVYEFMSNGTLATFLFEGSKPSWNQRTLIAFGIARGLSYLHEECSTQIIHCDIKPQNVLLDEFYNARVSDFGLAKLCGIDQSQSPPYNKTTIRGTKGYIAPDWFRSAPVSCKVDVYSFGVLLLDIVCCRRNLDVKGNLTDWAYDCYREGRVEALVENDMEAMNDMKMVERFVMVAIWCLNEDPSVRPTMKNVMLMLEGIKQVEAPSSPWLSSSIS